MIIISLMLLGYVRIKLAVLRVPLQGQHEVHCKKCGARPSQCLSMSDYISFNREFYVKIRYCSF